MDCRTNSTTSNFRVTAFAVLALAVLAVAGATGARAQDPGNEKVAVGTYNPQQAFEQYPGREELMKAYQSVQGEMAKAREEGNQQKTQQLQQQLQQKQQDVIEKFENAVKKALPKIAEREGLILVATEVQFSADNVETRDITATVVDAIGGEEKETPAPRAPRRR